MVGVRPLLSSREEIIVKRCLKCNFQNLFISKGIAPSLITCCVFFRNVLSLKKVKGNCFNSVYIFMYAHTDVHTHICTNAFKMLHYIAII